MRIGLLEDNPAILDYMVTALVMAGHNVSPHTQGASLLQAIFTALQGHSSIPYDVVVVDVLLADTLSGTDTIVRIREYLGPEVLPVVIVSACSQAELSMIHATFPDVSILRKPFKMGALLQTITRLQRRQSPESIDP